MSKIKYTIHVRNNDAWPRVNRDGMTIGNYLEWTIEDENELSPEIEAVINKIVGNMSANGLGFFAAGEELEDVIDTESKSYQLIVARL